MKDQEIRQLLERLESAEKLLRAVKTGYILFRELPRELLFEISKFMGEED